MSMKMVKGTRTAPAVTNRQPRRRKSAGKILIAIAEAKLLSFQNQSTRAAEHPLSFLSLDSEQSETRPEWVMSINGGNSVEDELIFAESENKFPFSFQLYPRMCVCFRRLQHRRTSRRHLIDLFPD